MRGLSTKALHVTAGLEAGKIRHVPSASDLMKQIMPEAVAKVRQCCCVPAAGQSVTAYAAAVPSRLLKRFTAQQRLLP